MSTYSDQAALEYYFNKEHIRDRVRQSIDESNLEPVIATGVDYLTQWINHTAAYESKQRRLDHLKGDVDLHHLVKEILITVLPLHQPTLLTQVVGQIHRGLGFDQVVDGVKTAAEILAVLQHTGLFGIGKIDDDEENRWYLMSNCSMSDELMDFLQETQYQPPMVCTPNVVSKNYDKVHLTYHESMILGSHNHHNDDICLDHINRMNQIPLCLDTQLLSAYSEQPDNKINDPEKLEQWESFVRNSYRMYLELVKAGNRFHIPHKYDKRGRSYSQGYHVNIQGNSFRKAIIDYADKEVVHGVPSEYRL